MKLCTKNRLLFPAVFATFLALPLLCPTLMWADQLTSDNDIPAPSTDEQSSSSPDGPQISAINVVGNHFTHTQAILNYVPYRVNQIFDPQQTGPLMRSLYTGLHRFRNIWIYTESVGQGFVNLHIVVEEKKQLKDIIFKGNKAVTNKEIEKKVSLDIPAIDQEELKLLAIEIKKLYQEKGYRDATIDSTLELDADNKAIAIFTINEGKKSLVKRIMFTGNKHVGAKQLRAVLFSKEDWILSVLDGTATYHPEKLQADKQMLEQYYQNSGFLHARITDVNVENEPGSSNVRVTFDIEEGDRYTIDEVKAKDNDVLPGNVILANIPIRPGQYYSRERIGNAIKALERLWGNYGYIFAHIEPSIQPDEETKTVSLSFFSDLGQKTYLNRLTIRGNKKARDKIIRRRLILQEGEMITNTGMEWSKSNVESLGYFDQKDGVNWKTHRLGDNRADLDLLLNETKTGHANVQLGYGGSGLDLKSPASGISVKGTVADTNLFGSGTAVSLEGSWAQNEQTIIFHLSQPWLFDKALSGATDVYHKRPSYDQLKNIDVSSVNCKLTGGALGLGFVTRSNTPIFHDTQILFNLGIDSVRYERRPQARFFQTPPSVSQEYQCILNREFDPGDFVWLASSIEQNLKNNPMHPSRGHYWKLLPKVAIPSLTSNIGFWKLSFDAHWYTPLIEQFNLVLHMHWFLGLVTSIRGNNIPYGELFNIGGDHSVRGFLYGQIGPRFLGDPIGAKKALFFNAELIFPITPDMSIKGIVFYDGGAGWDNPNTCCITNCQNLAGNTFSYRHSVGFGIRVYNPMPIKVDWGFKLDRRTGETASEVHFGTSYDW